MWRSSTLILLDRHCPRALDYQLAGAPRDRDVFDVGIAAHACLDALARLNAQRDGLDEDQVAQVLETTVRELVTVGRSFDGIAEPPMAPARATEGAELARDTWLVHPVGPDLRSELGLGVDDSWRPAPYSSARYKAACDVVGPISIEEDGFATTGLLVQDWKSAWPTDATELDTRQLRGQACVAYAHREALGVPEPSFIRRRVVNLRTLAAHEEDLWLDDAGLAALATWRSEIEAAMAQADVVGADGRRPARPGAGCLGCPWLVRCEAAREHLVGTRLDGSPEMIATRLAVVDALREELWAACRELAAPGPIAIPGGRVGFVAQAKRSPAKGAAATLAHHWYGVTDPESWDAENGRPLGLLTAIAPGVTAIEGAAKALYPFDRRDSSWKDHREALIAAATTTTTAAKFGIHREEA